MAARMDFSNLAIRLSARENENDTLKAEIELLHRLLGETRQANKKFVKDAITFGTLKFLFPIGMIFLYNEDKV
jgi:hypothetical protein